MMDDSSPLVPSPKKTTSSSWNFEQLQGDEDESNSSNDFFSDLRKSITKNVYFNEEIKSDSSSSSSKKNHSCSTVRVDTSDLISRCKTFLPLLTDANRNLFSKIQSGENVRIELDSDDEHQEQTIEMNLMFCPNVDCSSSSSSSDSEEQIESNMLSWKKTNNPGNIVEITSDDQEKN